MKHTFEDCFSFQLMHVTTLGVDGADDRVMTNALEVAGWPA